MSRDKVELDYLWRDRKRTFLGLPWSFTKYSLTEDRLFIESGLLSIDEQEIRLYRILDITLKCSLYQRIFGLGTIHCNSADHSTPVFDIKDIKNPRSVKEMLSKCVEEERNKKRVSSREFMDIDETGDDIGEDNI